MYDQADPAFKATENLIALCGTRDEKLHLLFGATISFVMSVRPSAWNNSPSTGGIFINLIFEIFSKIYQENQTSLKSDKNNRYFT
jgi:hypothetical protein